MPKKSLPNYDEKHLISSRILRNMANTCVGDKDKIYKALLKNYAPKNERFREAMMKAWHYLAWSEMTSWKTLERQRALKRLEKIRKAASTLDELLPQMSSSQIPEARSLEEYMYNFIINDSKPEMYEDNLDGWREFKKRLEEKIRIFDDLEQFISNIDKNLRPTPLTGLKDFIYQIAILYTQATGKKFTVDRQALGDKGKRAPSTEGMRFAKESLEAIYALSSKPYRFTPANFQNACEAVSKRIRKSEKL